LSLSDFEVEISAMTCDIDEIGFIVKLESFEVESEWRVLHCECIGDCKCVDGIVFVVYFKVSVEIRVFVIAKGD
jgi:hypothetical protein